MTDERKSVRRLLERAGTYTDPAAPAPGTDWRDAVLATIAEEADAEAPRPAAPQEEAGPLRPRHLLLMSPAGLALFGLGWWVGRGGVSAEELAVVPSVTWVVCAGLIAGASLAWYGVPRLGIGRGR